MKVLERCLEIFFKMIIFSFKGGDGRETFNSVDSIIEVV